MRNRHAEAATLRPDGIVCVFTWCCCAIRLQPAGPGRPCCSSMPGGADFPTEDLLEAKYLADLKLRGFVVDVADLSDVDRSRLSRYNVAVLLWLPPEPHGDLVDIIPSHTSRAA